MLKNVFNLGFREDTETEVLVEVEEQKEEIKGLVVYNDDHNTFDHVIETLMKVCEHTSHHAEQCAMIIHYNGKCTVKTGSFDYLAPMRNAICQRGISAEVL